MDCSKPEVFFGEFYRMCERNKICCECEMYKPAGNEACIKWISKNTKEAIEIVQKWSDEHPRKTRQSEFLKVFPNMLLDKAGASIICPKAFEGERFECLKIKSSDSTVLSVCDKCCKEYWLSEVE